MGKYRYFLILVCLLLLLSACKAPAPEPGEEMIPDVPQATEPPAPESPSVPLVEVFPLSVQTGFPTCAQPVDLSGKTMIVPLKGILRADSVVLRDGKEAARGWIHSVTDYATGEIVGYSVLSLPPGVDSSMWDTYDYIHGPQHYELYHLDGSYWRDCGRMEVNGILGDLFFGHYFADNTFGEVYSADPTDAESFLPAGSVTHIGEGRLLVNNYGGEESFLGVADMAVMDQDLHILMEFHAGNRFYERSAIFESGKASYLQIRDHTRLIDSQTMEESDYTGTSQFSNGYWLMEKASGRYDVFDAKGNLIAADCENRPIAINPYFRVEREELAEGADPNAPLTTYVFCGDELLMKVNREANVYLSFDRFFVWLNDEETLTRYDQSGNALDVRRIVSAEGENEIVAFRDDSGANWAVRDEIYKAEPTSVSGSCRAEEALLAVDEGTSFPNNRLTDVFGHEYGSGFDSIYPTDYDGVYLTWCAERRGILGQDGSWIWSEPINDNGNGETDSR